MINKFTAVKHPLERFTDTGREKALDNMPVINRQSATEKKEPAHMRTHVCLALALSFMLGLFTTVKAESNHIDLDRADVPTERKTIAPELTADRTKIASKDSDESNEAKTDKQKKKHKDKDRDKDTDNNKDSAKSKDIKDEKPESKKNEPADRKDGPPANDGEKKKGGGLFHLGGKKKEEAGTQSKAEPVKKEDVSAKPAQIEDENAPKYKFDPALISLLKDINKNLKESEAITRLEDPAQKLVAKLVGETLEKGLQAPDLHANRIVAPKDKERLDKSGMVAEAWESGNIDVSAELKASVVALWAKRIDGLVTVEIVGNYEGKPDGAAEKLGEFIAVITAHSTVDKGFDIQSQQEVNFWIGKISDLKIDCSAGKPPAAIIKSHLKQYVPLTQRKREFLQALKDYEDRLARSEEEKKKQQDMSTTQKVAEELARKFSEVLARSVSGESASKTDGNPKVAHADKNAGGSDAEKKSEGASDISAVRHEAEAPVQKKAQESPAPEITASQTGSATNNPVSRPASESSTPPRGSSVTALIPEPTHNNRASWESPSAPASLRSPGPSASIIYPGRVVAGQYITLAVMGPQNTAEQFVGITFNGAQLSTGDNGKVVYQVPEDMPPGFSLHVALNGRPEEPANAIEVLQPLTTLKEPQIPSVEAVSSVCRQNGIITVSGHNFEGSAERNRVIVDGAYDASIMVSSPVQLKAQLPAGIPAGPHTLCVSTAGLRSNPGNFDLVTVDINGGGTDSRKLTVKVVGTQYRVRVKLVNESPDVVRLIKGDDAVIVTSGGMQNQAAVPVQRLRPGNYKITAELLL